MEDSDIVLAGEAAFRNRECWPFRVYGATILAVNNCLHTLASHPPVLTNAILLVAHGSRLDSANRDLQWLADSLSVRRPDDLIETAFLEIAEPDIPTGGARCVERGADRVLLVPFFLSPGRHASMHLAEHLDRLAERFPDVTWELKPPLGRHDALIDVILDRISGPAADPAAS
jgi:sirohydrochlorin ferrochelatase